MSKTEETKIPLKILVDEVRNKVVFAEADYMFVDILFGFMTLPMGSIVRLLRKNSASKLPLFGSFNSLYEGLTNLPSECFWKEECKDMLLNPRNSSERYCSQLKLNLEDTLTTKYYVCGEWEFRRHLIEFGKIHLFSICNSAKCRCGKLMDEEICFQRDSNIDTDHERKRGIFVNETATFIITDDLSVKPNLPGSGIRMLNDLGFRDMNKLEEMTVTIGIQEVLDLFMLALFSKCPLTSLFLRKKQTIQKLVKYESGKNNQPQVDIRTPASAISSSKKVNAKIFKRKSNGKLLFVQAGGDFIDFLFGFLAISLGTVEWLLRGANVLPNIDNLYRSLSNMNVGQYMKSQNLKNMLLQPPLLEHYLSKNQIFTLKEASPLTYYYHTKWLSGFMALSQPKVRNYEYLRLKDPRINGEFVRGTLLFMVTDDLVVTPLSSIATISYLDKLKVPLSDVAEHEVNIGIEEALGILKASLSSSSALSSGLNHLLLKKPKTSTLMSIMVSKWLCFHVMLFIFLYFLYCSF